ncbi:MAG TPA: protein-methionine-sulfoxide reductase heme-binding subunit MsrQ [Acetobacteraceae bacterium]|nr:protein-methionine-sulfoxide reductase heme-binding subunit MsrQ [Acetobacteraceae bacterium]
MADGTITRMAAVRPAATRRRPRALPWRDRQGRLSWLKAATLGFCVTPGLLTAYWLATGQLGARPITEALHETGLWTVRFLMISLALTPARLVFDWPRAPLIRRMVGVTAACYAGIHFTLYIAQQNFHLLFVASEIVHRFYLTIGFAALVGLVALAATSTDAATRRMGKNWKRLHRAVYVIAVLALLHYFIQSKANVGEPVVFAGLFLWLMLWRLLPGKWGGAVAVLPALGIVAAALAAGVEYAWYDIATHVNAWRVLMANERWRLMRPAHWVLVSGAGIFALALLRRLWLWLAVRPWFPRLRRAAGPGMLRPRQP